MQLRHRLFRCCDEAHELRFEDGEGDTVLGQHMGEKVFALLRQRMWIGDSAAELERFTPKPKQTLEERRIVINELERHSDVASGA